MTSTIPTTFAASRMATRGARTSVGSGTSRTVSPTASPMTSAVAGVIATSKTGMGAVGSFAPSPASVEPNAAVGIRPSTSRRC